MLISYRTLRKAIGVLGVTLPAVLALGGLLFFRTGIQPSISDYYYTGMRNYFVGAVFAIGVFLFSYKGHEWKDDLAGDAACLFAVVLALFPTDPTEVGLRTWVGVTHLVSATLFFLVLIYFSLCLFTKGPLSEGRRKKNRIYRACGYAMLSLIFLIFVYYMLRDGVLAFLRQYRPVFVLESAAMVAFGVSWFTKGLREGPPEAGGEQPIQ